MFRPILIWLSLIPDPRPVELSPEGKAMIARLDEMYRDVYRLTHEEWKVKWRPDTQTVSTTPAAPDLARSAAPSI